MATRDRKTILTHAVRLAALGGVGLCLLHLLLVVVQGFVPLATIVVIERVVDTVASGARSSNADPALDRLTLLIGLATGLLIASQVLRSVTGIVAQLHGDRVSDRVTTRIHEHANSLGLGDFEDPTFHDAMQRAQSEGPRRPVAVVAGLAGLVRASVTAATMVIVVASLHWAAPLLVAAAALPSAIVRLRHARRLLDWQVKHTSDLRLANYYTAVLTSPQAAKDVRAFGIGDELSGRHAAIRTELRDGRFVLARARGVAEALGGVPAVLALFGFLWWLGRAAIGGTITLGVFVLQVQAIQRLQASVSELYGGVARLLEDGLFFEQYIEFLERAGAIRVVEPQAEIGSREAGVLRFEGVSFAYPGRKTPALDTVDLELRPGERTAIVGPNGAGKSTLIRLLCRLQDPDVGRITWNDVDIRHFDPRAWRRTLAVLFQDAVPFEVSLRDNIAFGDLEGSTPVEAAARTAGIAARVESLPTGYETRASRRFPDGTELSVGERRKLLLARVLHRDAPFVVLDEPSASLDPRSEVDLFQRLAEAIAADRTLLFVTHRPATLEFANRIVELRAGSIVRDDRRSAPPKSASS